MIDAGEKHKKSTKHQNLSMSVLTKTVVAPKRLEILHRFMTHSIEWRKVLLVVYIFSPSQLSVLYSQYAFLLIFCMFCRSHNFT